MHLGKCTPSSVWQIFRAVSPSTTSKMDYIALLQISLRPAWDVKQRRRKEKNPQKSAMLLTGEKPTTICEKNSPFLVGRWWVAGVGVACRWTVFFARDRNRCQQLNRSFMTWLVGCRTNYDALSATQEANNCWPIMVREGVDFCLPSLGKVGPWSDWKIDW